MGRPRGKQDSEVRVRVNRDMMSLGEIARELRVNPKTVKSLLDSAIYKLRKNPAAFAQLIGLAEYRQSLRGEHRLIR